MTYKIYLENNPPLYPERDVGRADGAVKTQCPCGGWAFPQIMIDVRGFHNILTDGQEFACDGCISKWERTLRPISPGDEYLIRHEFRAKFNQVKNGQPDIAAEQVATEYLQRELNKVIKNEMRVTLLPENNPEKIRLKAKRLALEAKL